MNTIRVFAAVCLLLAVFSAESADQTEMARVQAAMDAAYKQTIAAKEQQRGSTTNALPSPPDQELRNAARADPLRIAKDFENKQNKLNVNQHELLVFISTSMPKNTLKLLGEQAKKAGAVLVLRGMVGKVGVPGVLNETIRAIQPAAETGATVQIDPEQFSRFDVTIVPTFVIARKQQECGTEQCATQSFKLVGDVSLEYALETWVERGGEAGKLAGNFLSDLR